jgi:hypothetical protein
LLNVSVVTNKPTKPKIINNITKSIKAPGFICKYSSRSNHQKQNFSIGPLFCIDSLNISSDGLPFNNIPTSGIISSEGILGIFSSLISVKKVSFITMARLAQLYRHIAYTRSLNVNGKSGSAVKKHATK